VGVAAGECVGWLPAQVLTAQEALDVTLRAFDAAGKQATCMKWGLAFGAQQVDPEAWAPPTEPLPATAEQAMRAVKSRVAGRRPPVGDGPSANNTKEARHQSMYDYLDSMSHHSHRCVRKGEPFYWNGSAAIDPDWAFPSTGGKSVLHMRLSHALLAATGTVWAIDRSCRDSLIGCVGHIDGLPDPHCHTVCSFTWEMGPGGVANFSSGGTDTLTHHLPSPGIALVQQLKTDGKAHDDRGCGDAGPRA
jgi:hypothetical protein